MNTTAFEEFLDLPETGEKTHYELIGGTLYNMAPPSPEHQIISRNLANLLQRQLPKGPCQVIQDVYVKLTDELAPTRPDILLTCELADYHPKYREKKHHRVRSPRLIVEILSHSTEEIDRGEKFERYQQSPTLEVYLLVHQSSRWVEVYQRMQDWQQRDYQEDAHFSFLLGGLQFNLDLEDIYAGL